MTFHSEGVSSGALFKKMSSMAPIHRQTPPKQKLQENLLEQVSCQMGTLMGSLSPWFIPQRIASWFLIGIFIKNKLQNGQPYGQLWFLTLEHFRKCSLPKSCNYLPVFQFVIWGTILKNRRDLYHEYILFTFGGPMVANQWNPWIRQNSWIFS